MKTRLIIAFLLLLHTTPVLSMNNYDDPRKLLSFMDQSLAAELDILRVTTKVSAQNDLVFQVKMRGESAHVDKDIYILLHITHGDTYALLVPVNKDDKVLMMLKQIPVAEKESRIELAREFIKQDIPAGFSVERINQGMNFSLPIDWINFDNRVGYDAYTVRARLSDNLVHIEELYDRAGKGRKTTKQFSAITFMNRLCATRRK